MVNVIKYTDEFKKDAISQVVNRGYTVLEVSERLGMSKKTLYGWVREHKKPQDQIFNETTKLSKENRTLKAELARVKEERDILKKATAYFAKETL